MCSLHIGYIGFLTAWLPLYSGRSSNTLIHAANKAVVGGLGPPLSLCNRKASLCGFSSLGFLTSWLPHLYTAAEEFKSKYSDKQGGSCMAFYHLALEFTPCHVFYVLLIEIITKDHLVSLEGRYRPSPVGLKEFAHVVLFYFLSLKKISLLLLSLRYAC